jgi:transcriptional regulator NrdR family protein
MNIKFMKRNGSIEDYQEEKIIKVLIAAGLSDDDAKTVSAKITKWLASLKEFQVNSLQIRTKIIEELEKINKNVANLFQWYEKSKK